MVCIRRTIDTFFSRLWLQRQDVEALYTKDRRRKDAMGDVRSRSEIKIDAEKVAECDLDIRSENRDFSIRSRLGRFPALQLGYT